MLIDAPLYSAMYKTPLTHAGTEEVTREVSKLNQINTVKINISSKMFPIVSIGSFEPDGK